jgi:hypothetical protein
VADRAEDEPEPTKSPRFSWPRAVVRARTPAIVLVVCSLSYVAMLGDRIGETSPDDHFSHLAESFLAGELGVVGNQPDGTNDWACYDTVEHGACPINRYRFPASEAERYRWYVSFPPMPAVVMMPIVAAFGRDIPDRLVWALLAGFGPALLFVLLRFLSETGRSRRRPWENLLLSGLFAFGTVYFYTAVQGTVWFAAHVVAVPLTCLYVLFGLDARRPWLAGTMLALAFMTRPSIAFLAPFFLVEALKAARPDDAPAAPEDSLVWKRLWVWLGGVRWGAAVRPLAAFAVPVLLVGGLAMWMNHARFEDPLEFGHAYLQIRWRPRIERWGLFSYHYFAKNLAVFVAAMPWLSQLPPYITISRHGIALWLSTPNLLWALWPKRVTSTMVGLFAASAVVCVLNLCYQNSGWVQFGYRFALDYLPLLFVLVALGGRRFGPGFILLAAFSIAINAFGAVTFDRAWQFYDGDPTQNVIFQPD